MKTLIYYHSPCMDGLTAAWVLLKALPDAIAKPARFGDPPPLDEAVGFDRVIFADVCYDKEILLSFYKNGHKVILLDHHATSEKMLEGQNLWTIDKSKSGAGLALRWAFEGFEKPPNMEAYANIVAYVQDRDLWQWKLPKSREVSAYLKASVQTFADLDDAATLLVNDFNGLVATGAVLLKDEQRRVQEAAERCIVKPIGELDGLEPGERNYIAFVNADPEIRSELGNYIGERWGVCSFVVVWSVAEDGTVRCSARGPGARQWCEARGGGGHDNAAGCEITLSDMEKMLR